MERYIPVWARARKPEGGKPGRGRALTVAWGLFLGIGLPFGLLAALDPLTRAGIFLEPLCPLWRPWPPDPLKPVIGAAVFIATFAYLAYRSGRATGFHSGTIAATATLRNMAERRGPETGQDFVPPPPTEVPSAVELIPPPG